ncbi:MAG: HEAT repeat domain-containing protein [Bacteroidales bacterium]|nr:HEAT repeat domain-containing protein [Bacteroidales bacterium]
MRYILLFILTVISAKGTIAARTAEIPPDSLLTAESNIPENETTFIHSRPGGITDDFMTIAESNIPENETAFVNSQPLDYIINETNVRGFITSLRDNFPVQLGAFRIRFNAEAFFNEVKRHIDGNAIMFREDDWYKIRISGNPMPEDSGIAEAKTAKAGTAKAGLAETGTKDSKIAEAGMTIAANVQQGSTYPGSVQQGSAQPGMETKDLKIRENPKNTTTENISENKFLIASADYYDSIYSAEIASDTSEVLLSAPTAKENDKAFIKKPPGNLLIGNNSPWLKRITYFGKSLALINALIITILFSISSMILLLVFILFNRRRMEKKQKLHQYLMEKYQELIINYLFGTAVPEDFRPIASDTYRRQVLIDQMIDVSINLKGEEAKMLLGLYKHLGLDRDSERRAHDRRWHKKIKGFRELAFMNIKSANETIFKALNSSNEILRMEAQIALVRLGDDKPFDFLNKLERPFSLWEQISLHELIVQHNLPLPEFSRWLNSPNPTVAMFALRMIREFNQSEAEEAVHGILMHPDPEIKRLAIQVAGDMNMRSTLETMKHMYKFQNYDVCLEIIKSMGKMPDLSLLGFLKLVLDKEDDVQLQIEATKAIENNGEEGVKALVKIMKSEYKNYNIIVRHVLDRRIY